MATAGHRQRLPASSLRKARFTGIRHPELFGPGPSLARSGAIAANPVACRCRVLESTGHETSPVAACNVGPSRSSCNVARYSCRAIRIWRCDIRDDVESGLVQVVHPGGSVLGTAASNASTTAETEARSCSCEAQPAEAIQRSGTARPSCIWLQGRFPLRGPAALSHRHAPPRYLDGPCRRPRWSRGFKLLHHVREIGQG